MVCPSGLTSTEIQVPLVAVNSAWRPTSRGRGLRGGPPGPPGPWVRAVEAVAADRAVSTAVPLRITERMEETRSVVMVASLTGRRIERWEACAARADRAGRVVWARARPAY